MNRRMLVSVFAALTLVGAVAQAQQGGTTTAQLAASASGAGAPRYLTVTGAGNDTESDQSTAHQNADSQAQTNLQNACPGTLTQSRKIYDVCSQTPDNNYMCSVTYVGTCQISN